ncbi:MAG TPA: hypothetical protein VNK04_20590 [Gemmataceae bacterium]|nr:hypothetical protein [Gemmataceae bacterium]
MAERFKGLGQVVSPQAMLGYLNFSQGRPDPRFQKQLSDAYGFLADHGAERPWQVLQEVLLAELDALHAGGASAFRDVSQARAVLTLTITRLLPAYRAHHADLLFHQGEHDLFQPFFLARAFEAVLAEGPPWDEEERIIAGALARLNDFVGHRPIAILETRPRGEPYDHERVRPIPLYLRGAGVARGRYHDLVARALDILAATDPAILAEAQFDLQLLDEFAFDPRAYDHGHPANRRPNYVFGEWDPHHLDSQGRFRRYVARQVTLDALLDRVVNRGPLDRDEVLFEAAAVLAGTVLMAAGTSGPSPTAYDSSTTLATLLPRIARYRDAFYTSLLGRMTGPHAERLRQEAAQTRQPFGGARQHLNQYLARHRAIQLQQRHLAVIFAEMGYPEASRREAARIPVASVRLLSEILSRLATGQILAERGDFAGAARLLPEAEDLLHRGIACGAFVDPWNILGFQGLFPLSAAREDSVRDPRVDELIHLVESLLNLYARLMSEAAAAGQAALVQSLTERMRRLAAWWDRFATTEVSDVHKVHGGAMAASAEHVAAALALWHERGAATADIAFWKQYLPGFRSPEAFALVIDALLRRPDYRAAMALLVNWLGQAEQVPLAEGEHSFHTLALRWLLGLTRGGVMGGRGEREDRDAAHPSSLSPEAWSLIKKFFDYLEANAEEYWEVPTLESSQSERDEEEGEDLYGAAYEGVTYRDSAADEEEGAVAEGGARRDDFDLEAEADRIEKRLTFLGTVARLWQVAALRSVDRVGGGPADAERAETLAAWLATARGKEQKLLALMDALHAYPIAPPWGSFDSVVEYERRRGLKEQLEYAAIGTCLETGLAVGALRGAIAQLTGAALPPLLLGRERGEGVGEAPPWEPAALRLEECLFRGDPAGARAALPEFVRHFRSEPLLFTALADGGQPRQILRARLAQTVLRALALTLPRLGLLRETYHLLKTAQTMEQEQPTPGRRVTEFNQLFESAFRAVVERVVEAAPDWGVSDRELVRLLEELTGPFLALWIEHSRTLRLSTLETLRRGSDWSALQAFIQRYGGDLFHVRFMTLANLRGILHRGVGAYLDYLRDNPDPLHPIRLINDLERADGPEAARLRNEAVELLQFIFQVIVENYEEYKDYNSTTTQSDYGENLHVLLDFLRLKASYERQAWQFRPLVLVHEVLARAAEGEAAVLWEEAFGELTQEPAAQHLDELTRLERAHGIRLGTVRDRLEERFIKPLALDRLCALVEPAMEEARRPGEQTAFAELERELQDYTANPSGVGLDVPHWLRRLEAEVQRARAARSSVALLAGSFLQVPDVPLTLADLRSQLADWDRPLE